MRKQLLLSVFVLFLFGSAIEAQQYFPPGALDSSPASDQFLSKWYSKQLRALDEPSLWSLSKTQKEETYRFLWLRTFHRPVAIRIDVSSDEGTSWLTTKMTSGAGGYDPGRLVLNSRSLLTKEQTDLFLGKIKEQQFWELAPARQSGGEDGAQWILEGVKNGKYHIVDRWSPKDGPVRVIGLSMVNEFAKLKIPASELY